MIAGVLEIQMMANLARLSDDMRRAERVVGDSMGKVERSVVSAKTAMSSLGMGMGLGLVADQMRRTVDTFTKLDAQVRLSTDSQQAYNQAFADIRRISTVAQSDIAATTMLYTRLMNVMDGTGVSQAKLATVTETVSYGLKAYGATSAEAASAALQLSQAMGANRLGGEEFRAVMEAMPNVMKVLAKSMGVPLGELRALSIAGKITAAEMVKAFGDPAIAAEFKKMAEGAQTITGAWTVARNEFTMLLGEFAKSSGLTQGVIASFNGLAGLLRITAQYIDDIVVAFGIWAVIVGGKLVASLVAARLNQMALNAAHAEALVLNVAMARTTDALAAANLRLSGATAQTARAQALLAASTQSTMSRMMSGVGKAGLIGMALWGAYEVADYFGWIDKIFSSAEKRAGQLKSQIAGMNQAELEHALKLAEADLVAQEKAAKGRTSKWDIVVGGGLGGGTAELIAAQEKVADIKKKLAENHAAMVGVDFSKILDATNALDENLKFVNVRFAELNAQLDAGKISRTEYVAGIKKMYSEIDEAAIMRANSEKVLTIEREKYAKLAEQRALFNMTEAEAIVARAEFDVVQAQKEFDAAYAKLGEDYAAKKKLQEEFDAWKIAKTQFTADEIAKIAADKRKQENADARRNFVEDLKTLGTRSQVFFELYKAAAIAEIMIAGAVRAEKAAAWAAQWGPYASAAAAAVSWAATLVNAASIASQSSSGGGGGGSGGGGGGGGGGVGSNSSPQGGAANTPPPASGTPAQQQPITVVIQGAADNMDKPLLSYNQALQLIPHLERAAGEGRIKLVAA